MRGWQRLTFGMAWMFPGISTAKRPAVTGGRHSTKAVATDPDNADHLKAYGSIAVERC